MSKSDANWIEEGFGRVGVGAEAFVGQGEQARYDFGLLTGSADGGGSWSPVVRCQGHTPSRSVHLGYSH